MLCTGIVHKYHVRIVYFNKTMKVLTYTSYNKHCNQYNKIHILIAVNSCQIGLTQKDIILLSEVSIVIYKAGKNTDV